MMPLAILFIQCSEQVKSRDFCPVRPVEPFDKGILCQLTRLDKVRASQPIAPKLVRSALARCPFASSSDSHGLPQSSLAPAKIDAPEYSGQFL